MDAAGFSSQLKQATPEAFLGGDERTPLTGARFFLEVTAHVSERMHSLTAAALQRLEQARRTPRSVRTAAPA